MPTAGFPEAEFVVHARVSFLVIPPAGHAMAFGTCKSLRPASDFLRLLPIADSTAVAVLALDRGSLLNHAGGEDHGPSPGGEMLAGICLVGQPAACSGWTKGRRVARLSAETCQGHANKGSGRGGQRRCR